MKKYEKQLSQILLHSENGSILLFQDSYTLSESELRYLSARNLIALFPAGDDIFSFAPTADGITYFDRKHERRMDFIKDLLSRFSIGVATGVVTTLLIEHIILPLLSRG